MSDSEKESKNQTVPETKPRGADTTRAQSAVTDDVTQLKADLDRELKNEENLKDMLAQSQREKEEWMNKFCGELADVQNLRKDIQRDNESALKYRAEPFVQQLVPFLNSFDMAFKSEPQDEAAKGWVEGMHMIYKQLMKALGDEGISEINPVKGEPFDPHTMEAIQSIPGDKPDLVASVFLKGYKLKDRLIRPASVLVTVVAPPVAKPAPAVEKKDDKTEPSRADDKASVANKK